MYSLIHNSSFRSCQVLVEKFCIVHHSILMNLLTYRGQKYLPEDIKNLHYSNTSYLDRQIKAKITIDETLFSYRGINYKKSKPKQVQKT